MPQADIGLIGLAVMGQNLVLNMNDHGFTVAVFNRTTSKVDEFISGPAKGTKVIGTHSLKDFFGNLKRPRKVVFLVKAGQPVDDLVEECLPFLEKGDVIIDGGNSNFNDTDRRFKELKAKGILFVGSGVSGGEEGARNGPSLMPGGDKEAWPLIKEIFQAISAKAGSEPCCDWVGDGGAGHYVKMVHNGIEYGDMQLIGEAYNLMKHSLNLSNDEISDTFSRWNKTELDSYLIEITANIFKYKEQDGSYLIDKILDVAGQKGTGKWTAISALDLGQPLTLIGEAVFARCLSSLKDERQRASSQIKGPEVKKFTGDKKEMLENIRHALYASKIISYAQGYMLMREAAKEYKWQLNYGGIALMWRGGCIIRSQFLGKIKEAFDKNPSLENLLLDPYFKGEIEKCQEGWRKAVGFALTNGLWAPCFSTALTFFDGLRTKNLAANLIQAQRDYFGAHTYERIDKPRGQFFHTNWTGTGGNVSSSTYNA
jgi:6-phosphogluconate dehydrogenase